MGSEKTLRKYLIGFAIAFVAFSAMDAVWLTQSYDRLYKPEIGDLMAAKPDMVAAIAFYLIYLAGMTHFAVVPAVNRGGVLRAIGNGALLGLMAYATYDLTNQATLKVWSVKVTLFDLAWGVIVTSVASGVSAGVTRRIVKA